MDFEDDAFVLSARTHGEAGAIVELLTQTHGRFVAHVAGGASRKVRPFLQPGARVIARYRSRVAEQLGSAQVEPVGEGPSALFDDPMALAGLAAATAVAAGALPEREAHPGAFLAFEALSAALAHILRSGRRSTSASRRACCRTWALAWICRAARRPARRSGLCQPRTGRAVSRAAGAPYADRLLALPPFLLSAQGGLQAGDVGAGLSLTGHFLETFVFSMMNRPLPPPRVWLMDRLREAGRL